MNPVENQIVDVSVPRIPDESTLDVWGGRMDDWDIGLPV